MTNREKFLAGHSFYLNQLPENIFCFADDTMYNVTASGDRVYHAYIPRMTSKSFTIYSDTFGAPSSVKCLFNMITFLPVSYSLTDYLPYILKGFAVVIRSDNHQLGPGAIFFLGDEWIRVFYDNVLGVWCFRNDEHGIARLEEHLAINGAVFTKEPADYDK